MTNMFRIAAQTPDGLRVVTRPTAQAALEKARELIREGIQVTVTAPDGSEHSVECLSRVSCAGQAG